MNVLPRFILIFLFALISVPRTAAQYVLDTVPEPMPNANLLREGPTFLNQIKFSPIRIFDPFNPGFEVSYERIYSRWSTQVSVALLADPLKITGHDKYSGVRLAIEQKYFFIQSRKIRPYVSLDLVQHQITIHRTDQFSPYPDGYLYSDDSTYYEVYTDSYRIEKQMVTVNTKIGLQANLGKVVLDFGIGVGLKFKTVQHFERTNLSHSLVHGKDPTLSLATTERGRYTTPNLPLNLKAGLLF
ncbi:MAG: hypothetical protein IPI00_04840 [Flavobacteriales bacterium]|nr:hypothetical protein [Flavobacteriales bacterium]MBK7296045.1 hypothetical protein [Flavobacteriales bacterium]MBP9138808.1 hypothetical protein [Flavobacteriales bacterium]HQV52278.1 hypothetical protein [Flavobacteriales bacterium]HQX30140.1 hypothetical protein [Flavobacteriales bacterium]